MEELVPLPRLAFALVTSGHKHYISPSIASKSTLQELVTTKCSLRSRQAIAAATRPSREPLLARMITALDFERKSSSAHAQVISTINRHKIKHHRGQIPSEPLAHQVALNPASILAISVRQPAFHISYNLNVR